MKKHESSKEGIGKVTHAEDMPQISLANAKFLASYQAVPALSEHRTLKEMIEIAREEHAREVANEGQY